MMKLSQLLHESMTTRAQTTDVGTRAPKPFLRRVWHVLLIVIGLFVLSGLLAFSTASPAGTTFLGSSCAASPAASCTTQPTQVWHSGYTIHHPGYWQWQDGYDVWHAGYWEWHSGHQQCYPGHYVHHSGGCGYDDYGYEECWPDWYEWVDGYCDWIPGYNEWHPGYWETKPGYWETIPGYWEHVPGYYETVYTEVCDTNADCTGTCPANQQLKCNGVSAAGGCGGGANCWCVDQNGNVTNSQCNSASDCAGNAFTCPNTELGGAVWSCQSHQCIAICGDNNNNNNNNGNPTSVPPPPVPPTSTPIPTPTRTPIPVPTPIVVPHCPPNPEDYGGSVTSVVPPGAPVVQMASQPTYPVVVGQDAAKRGADLTAQISVGACTINWHYRVREDYIYCGPNKPVCDCTKDDCELRQRWKEWDDTCTEDYPLAGVTIDGKLSQDSVNYINGPLQQKYPGAKVYQGSIRFFPSPLAQQTEYTVGNPTIWAMAGAKYPLQDPGGWDITINIATQQTTHCGPLQWSLPFPKWLTVYLREQTLTK